MPTINCLIIDDEPLAQDVIENHLKHFPEFNIVAKCSNTMEAFEQLNKEDIQLLFLDINMPVISGISFLKALKQPPLVVFTTAYSEYAIEGYELEVVDYLLKPISLERMEKAIAKVKIHLGYQSTDSSNDKMHSIASPATTPDKPYFFIKADGKLVKINYSDIKYIEGMKDYLKIYTHNSFFVVHKTMKAMEDQLPKSMFLRVHKSFIVALPAVKSIEGNMIHLEKDTIPLGASYKEELLTYL